MQSRHWNPRDALWWIASGVALVTYGVAVVVFGVDLDPFAWLD